MAAGYSPTIASCGNGSGAFYCCVKASTNDPAQQLSLAAAATGKKGCLPESLALWQSAVSKIKLEHYLEHYQQVYSAMMQILKSHY